jgi:hypothetical protein
VNGGGTLLADAALNVANKAATKREGVEKKLKSGRMQGEGFKGKIQRCKGVKREETSNSMIQILRVRMGVGAI